MALCGSQEQRRLVDSRIKVSLAQMSTLHDRLTTRTRRVHFGDRRPRLHEAGLYHRISHVEAIGVGPSCQVTLPVSSACEERRMGGGTGGPVVAALSPLLAAAMQQAAAVRPLGARRFLSVSCVQVVGGAPS